MVFQDQLGRHIRIDNAPRRIISLVPSITELLADLGLEEHIAGITKFCIRPDSIFRTKPRVGGTKSPDFDKINSINPDLIIANKEENNKEDIERLAENYPVWISDVGNLDEAIQMIQGLGQITSRQNEAEQMAQDITKRFAELSFAQTYSSVYLIWKETLMAAGSDTFINDMMLRCGFLNVIGEPSRYPEMTMEQILQLNPAICMLSSEPFPFSENDEQYFSHHLAGVRCIRVDGEFFSWYGSRLLHAPDYFRQLDASIRATA